MDTLWNCPFLEVKMFVSNLDFKQYYKSLQGVIQTFLHKGSGAGYFPSYKMQQGKFTRFVKYKLTFKYLICTLKIKPDLHKAQKANFKDKLLKASKTILKHYWWFFPNLVFCYEIDPRKLILILF